MTWIDTEPADDIMPRCASGMQPVCLIGEAGSSPVRGANE